MFISLQYKQCISRAWNNISIVTLSVFNYLWEDTFTHCPPRRTTEVQILWSLTWWLDTTTKGFPCIRMGSRFLQSSLWRLLSSCCQAAQQYQDSPTLIRHILQSWVPASFCSSLCHLLSSHCTPQSVWALPAEVLALDQMWSVGLDLKPLEAHHSKSLSLAGYSVPSFYPVLGRKGLIFGELCSEVGPSKWQEWCWWVCPQNTGGSPRW